MMVQKGPGANATVTVVHTRTKDLAAHCQRADILIVAAGVPGLVNCDFADVRTVMLERGDALMGTGIADGDARIESTPA